MAPTARIGTKIKRARERMRLSQADVARQLGVSRSAVNAWENDRAYPQSSIGALEALYGISLDGEPEREPELPSAEDLEDLRRNIVEALGDGERAARMLAALDNVVSGAKSSSPNAAPGEASSKPSRRRAG